MPNVFDGFYGLPAGYPYSNRISPFGSFGYQQQNTNPYEGRYSTNNVDGQDPPPDTPTDPTNPGTNSPPYVQPTDITAATTRNILTQWQPQRYTQTYGGRPAQFPDLNTQIGAAMYSNITPQPKVPSWAVQTLPSRQQWRNYMSDYGPAYARFGVQDRTNPYPLNNYGLTNLQTPFTSFPQYLNPFISNQGGQGNFSSTIQGLLGALR